MILKKAKHAVWIYTARLNLGNVLEIEDLAHEHSAYSLLSLIKDTEKLPKEAFQKLKKQINKAGYLNDMILAKWLRDNGINTLMYKNVWEDPGSTSYIITDPNQVRILKKSKAILNYKRGFDKLSDWE
jgi:hypothetical protein